MRRIYLGTMTVVLEHRLMHGLSKSEQQDIAKRFADVLSEKFAEYCKKENLPFSVAFDIESVRPGCLEIKFKLFILFVGAITAVVTAVTSVVSLVAKYPELRKAMPPLVEDAGRFFECYKKTERMFPCLVQLKDLNVTKELYVVKEGDTLSRIVAEEWKIPSSRAHQAMVATVNQYPAAFTNLDMNKLKAGSEIGKPTDQMIKDVPRRPG